MCVWGEGELCAISGLNFKRSSNFHTIFRLRSFALSTATLALGLVCTSQQPIPAPVPAPVPQPCSALADSPLLVGTCSVTHSSSSDSSCAFHIFACASCHLCHRNISNTCHSTGVWWEVRSVLCCAMVWWGCWLRVVGWGVARPLWPHSRFRFA